VIAYASRTGTRTTLAALRAAGWRLLVSAAGVLRTEGFRYALDNGAWSAFQRGQAFDEPAFMRALDMLGASADFVVVPDIVCGGEASLELSWRWLARVLDVAPVALFAVQDGHEPWQLDEVLGPRIGIFVGGSTEWKIATMRTWAATARARSAWCHVGRVNTARRIALCADAGVTSFDGTSVTKFPSTLPLLERSRSFGVRQGRLLLDGEE
jgi:hypothetical protein